MLGEAGNLINGANPRDLEAANNSKEYANIPWSTGYVGPFNQPPPPMAEMNTSYPFAMPKDHGDPTSQQADPQALAALIQQQLEVINDEIEMIQVGCYVLYLKRN